MSLKSSSKRSCSITLCRSRASRSIRFRKVTARQVLSHSSGLPHGERGKPYPIFFEPGEKYKYSAGGYYYLQLVVEHLKNKPLEQIIQEQVLNPIEMRRSSMVWKEDYESQAAVGHDFLGETTGEFRKRTRAHAAATLYTTAEDYARFVVAVLNGSGLKGSSLKEMLTPQIEVDSRVFWSLGFGIQRNPAGELLLAMGRLTEFAGITSLPSKRKRSASSI